MSKKYDIELIEKAISNTYGPKLLQPLSKAGLHSRNEWEWNDINKMLVKIGADFTVCAKVSNEIEKLAKDPHYMDLVYESKEHKMKTFKEALKESKVLKEDTIPMDWLRDLMKDVKRGEGWCTVDYIQQTAELELGKNLWHQEKEIKDAVNKLGFGSILKESKKLTESKKRAWDEIEFENIAAGLKISDGYDGLYLHTYSGGSGFNRVWKSDKYNELTKQAQETKDWKIVGKEIESLTDELAKAADAFDKEVASIMAKHGFRK